MAHQAIWFFSDLPNDLVELLEKDLSVNFDSDMSPSTLQGDRIDKKRRNSKNAWIPMNHWVAGIVWHFVSKANRDNFLYDLDCIDSESLQYTRYKPGEFYNWHQDTDLGSLYKPNNVGGSSISQESANDFINVNCEKVRKLSIIIQLSHPHDYEGGNVEFMDDRKRFVAPRHRGAVIVFDSRINHRVTKVTSGMRKSIVGWAIGPRWK